MSGAPLRPNSNINIFQTPQQPQAKDTQFSGKLPSLQKINLDQIKQTIESSI